MLFFNKKYIRFFKPLYLKYVKLTGRLNIKFSVKDIVVKASLLLKSFYYFTNFVYFVLFFNTLYSI